MPLPIVGQRPLTKSRYKLACECPTKLYYTKKAEYPDTKQADPFLAALAEGGHQVGEFAKALFPGGHDIETLNANEAVAQTAELLKQDNVIIFEAAIAYQNLFIRVDVLKKTGHLIELIEVKAKSYSRDTQIYCKDGQAPTAKWQPYIEDVAFQKYVLQKAFPQATVLASLMLCNKDAVAPSDGLFQQFLVKKDNNGRARVEFKGELDELDRKAKLLLTVPVDQAVDLVWNAENTDPRLPDDYGERLHFLADQYQADNKITPVISSACKNCEFRCEASLEPDGQKSGFHECWSQTLGLEIDQVRRPSVLDIWSYRGGQKLMNQGCYFMDQVQEEDLGDVDISRGPLTQKSRQWLQVVKTKTNDDSLWIDRDSLAFEMSQWQYPYHFIDFETYRPPIPMHKGRRPYENLAFQFSHHMLHRDGEVVHATEFFGATPGRFPSVMFVKALRATLEAQPGTVFMYSKHEQTTLNAIRRQLIDLQHEVSDANELIAFIESISLPGKKEPFPWESSNPMVDLLDVVKNYYFDPKCKGSNSLKYILPSILNRSKALQAKYQEAVYGDHRFINSMNFNKQIWVRYQDGQVMDPYQLLAPLFEGVSLKDQNRLFDEEGIYNGAKAMTAYARMQFTEMSDVERNELRAALLKYCELDTLAMVMLVEGWQDLCK